jgi:endoglucanase
MSRIQVRGRWLLAALLAPLLSASPALARPPAPGRALAPGTRLYVPPLRDGPRRQIADLVRHGRYADAARIAELALVPNAAWLEGGTPAEVAQDVRSHLASADAQGAVPVLVVYDLPYRDCAGYAGGGAKDAASYRAWIDALAGAVGRHKAVFIVETDAVGIIPWNTFWYGDPDWCQPLGDDGAPAPEADPETRYALLNYAVDALEALPGTSVYLDGTTSAWLDVGEAAYRLEKAGVRKAQGFFLNASNFQPTGDLVTYGTWLSQCLAAGAAGIDEIRGHVEYCPGQYNEAKGWALDYGPEHVAQVNARMKELLGGARPTTHFVLDTSRNARGMPSMERYAAPPYGQPPEVISALTAGDWCNPPGAGAGARPTTRTGVPLVDAFLWIKTPGESDGPCAITGGARQWDFGAYNPWGVTGDQQALLDPEWGLVDPAAGAWFPEQALDLVRNASPPFWP